MSDTEQTPKQKITQTMADLGLTISAEFVPWSKSRNAKPNAGSTDRSLNWKVSVRHNDREILNVDYAAGIANCPSYKSNARLTVDYVAALTFETEHGRRNTGAVRGNVITPELADVMASLILDSSAIDHTTFESWAGEFGYDTDSRKAEAIYRACLQEGLALRNSVGEAGLAKLREAAQDY